MGLKKSPDIYNFDNKRIFYCNLNLISTKIRPIKTKAQSINVSLFNKGFLGLDLTFFNCGNDSRFKMFQGMGAIFTLFW